MNLRLEKELGDLYTNPTQKARVVTESWMGHEGYCPSCLSALNPTATNFKAVDFCCSQCAIQFQLKSTKSKIGLRIPDGAYSAMISAVRSDTSPALVLMRYDLAQWMVRDLIIIPSFALTEQAIIPRKPLAPSARRAGWVGCNIDLGQIAPEARVQLVVEGRSISEQKVAKRYANLKPLQTIKVSQRGWALAVMNAVRKLGLNKFTTQEAYQIEIEMHRLFPGNRNVRPKIRQQLQVLRDLGILVHLDRGTWMFPNSAELI